jgi:Sporulation and spore germination
MIPRYQRILFWVLLLASVAMAVVLIRLREHAADRIAGIGATANVEESSAPLTAAPEESTTLLEANDIDGTVAPVVRQLALPKETGARARVLLHQLFADYAAPNSKHPLSPGPGVEEIFFMPASSTKTNPPTASGAETAIVNLTSAFAENHPSGIEPETLTLLSIIGTLHENFPAIAQVRFLVDGHPRETLAGHADLTRVYLTGER